MTRSLCTKGAKKALVLILLFLAASLLLLCPQAGAGPCNFSVGLYAKTDDADNPILKYALGEQEIPLIMLVRNDSQWPVNTDLGFSQVETDQYLIVTDPMGNKHLPVLQETLAHDDMPPLMTFNVWEIAPAEVLPSGWKRSVRIEDLRVLFPVMNELAGEYAIEAELPETCFGWTVATTQGLMGVLDENAFQGSMRSNQIRIFVLPALGAKLEIRVKDENIPDNPYREQVPVKIFRESDIQEGFSFEEAWERTATVTDRKTDFQGWAVTECLPEPEEQDSYVAVARYLEGYKETRFPPGGEGWEPDCSGLITREIVFGEPAMPVLSSFSAFALNSIWIKAGGVISSGHIGVKDASAGLWLDSGVEVSIGLNARLDDGVRIYGDSVKLWSGASVDDVYYNDIQSSGTIRGEGVTPLALPLPVQLPEFPEITAGTQNITVGIGRTTTLNPGRYRDVSVRLLGTLRLKEGVYHFRNLNIGAKSNLICLGPGPTEIRIKQRLYPGLRAKIRPLAESGLTAKDVVFYVEGTNGNLWDLFSYPRAAEIGSKNVVRASIYVPNGTLAIDAGSRATGAFVAQGVVVGIGTRVELESGF